MDELSEVKLSCGKTKQAGGVERRECGISSNERSQTGHWPVAIGNEDRLALFHAFDQPAELVLRRSNVGRVHMAKLAISERVSREGLFANKSSHHRRLKNRQSLREVVIGNSERHEDPDDIPVKTA